MKSYSHLFPAWKTVVLAMCAVFLWSQAATAQESGGDLGSGIGIFRPKNPETKSSRRTNKARPTGARTTPRRTTGGKNTGPDAAEIEDRVEDLLDEGNEARDARRYSDGEQAYKSALQLKPRDWRASYGLGNIYTDQQRWEEAERAYRQAVEANQLNADAQVALSYVLVQPRTGGSSAKRFTDAEAAARRAIQLQPTNAVAYDRLGVALEARAILNSDTEQAYRRAVELDPQFAVAYVHLARVLRKMNRASDAETYYARAIELAHDAPTLILIADALQSEQRYKEAEPLLRRALESDARNPNALFLLGRGMVALRRYDEAEPLLKSAIEVSPRSFSPYYFLGSTYLRSGRHEEAERIYVRAAEFASAGDRKLLAGAFGLSGVGDAYMKAGRATDAARVYQRALELDPSNAEIQSKLADARSRRQ
jgi:tetratricopeptide (TPR) repeat protein